MTIVAAADLVPGDIIVLEEGDSISADARVVRQYELSTNNIALTGESDAVRKTADPIVEEELATINMPNLVFMGTSVASGTGRAVVFATGLKTEFGRIYSLTAGVSEEKSPLMREIDKMARTVSIIAVVCGIALFFMGKLLGLDWVGALLFALGVMVALVPEGLPATLSVALSVGVQRMAKAKALIKNLAGVETLGSTNVIATDKTGTLTKAEMTLKAIWADGDDIEVTGAGYAPDGDFVVGDTTAAQGRGAPAARAAAARHDLLQRRQGPGAQRRQRLARDRRPDRGLPAGRRAEGRLRPAGGAHRTAQDLRAAVRERAQAHVGGPRRRRRPAGLRQGRALRDHRALHAHAARRRGRAAHRRAAASRSRRRTTRCRARRCACSPSASASLPNELTDYTPDTVETDLTFLGLVGMIDPPRPEVSAAVEEALGAGIRIIMVTGDYGLTAEAIARRIGIVRGDKHVRVITGVDLEEMDEKATSRPSCRKTRT